LPVAARFSRLPGSIEQSARLLGNSAFHVFRRIILPQASGSIAAGMLLVFLYAISDFGAVAILRYDTLTRAIEANQLNRPVALALSLLLLALAGVVVLAERAAQRRRRPGTTIRSDRAAKVQLGRARIPALVVASLIALLSLGAPLAAIIDWSVRGLAQGRALTIDSGEVARVTWHTLAVSAVAALATVLLVLPIAVLYGRYRSRVGAAGNAVAISTFALPGILVALAGTFFIRQTDWTFNTFHNTMVVLIFAYVVRFAALAMGTSLLAVLAVPDRMRDASQTLGATGLRRFMSVDLPLMTPGLLAAGGLVLLSVMKELPISLLLSPFEFETLSTRIFSTFNESFVTEAGLMALALVGLSFVATWFLVIRPSER
jgi:iron(III) transport system permease protein